MCQIKCFFFLLILFCQYLCYVQLHDDQSISGEREVKFQLAKDTLETMLKSMYFIRDQMSDSVSFVNRQSIDN